MYLLSLVGSSQSVFYYLLSLVGSSQSVFYYLLSLVGSSQSVFTVFGRQKSEYVCMTVQISRLTNSKTC